MKKSVLIILCSLSFLFSRAQDLSIPSSWGSNAFTTGTGDGASLTTYNSILKLHSGLAIGSPYVNNGSGGYIDKATIVFDGRTGNINTVGNIGSNSVSCNSIYASTLTSNSQIYFPTFNDYNTNLLMKGTGDGASLATYNTIIKLHSGLAIGSPYVNNGSGGFIDKATIVFDGRTGNIITYGVITSKKIHCSEVVVDLNIPAPDFVFKPDYKLMDLKTLENFVKTNQHLPEIASEKEMVKDGVNMKELQMKLLQKVEELTLYVIELKKENQQQNNTNEALLKKVEQLENKLNAITK